MSSNDKPPPQTETIPEIMTVLQSCEYAQVSRATLYRWQQRGLPVVHILGVVRIYRSELDRFLLAHQLVKTPRRKRRWSRSGE